MPRAARTSGIASWPAPQTSRRSGGSSTSTNARTPWANVWISERSASSSSRAVAIASASTAGRPSDPSGSPCGPHDDARAPGVDRVVLALEHGDHADRLFLLERGPQGVGDVGRLVGGLDEHLDRAVAAEPQAPDRVVVGGEVPAGEAGGALGHHHARHVGDVALEAAAADVADRGAFLGHEQARAGAPIGGASHGDDRGQGHALALGREGLDRIQHVGDLAHASMVAQAAGERRTGTDPSPPAPGRR